MRMWTRAATAAAICLAAMLPARADGLKIRDCYTVYLGLLELERKIVVDPKTDKPREEPTGYKLGDARWPMATNLTALQPTADSIERARRSYAAEIGSGKLILPNSPQDVEFAAKMEKILDDDCPVTLARIKRNDLKVGDGDGQNSIPFSTLSKLDRIIDK